LSEATPDEPTSIARLLADRPLIVLWACFGGLVAAGWGVLLAQSDWGIGSGFDIAALTSLCRADGAAWSVSAYGAVFAMWGVMVLAMMLPTAAPMVSVYLDIAGAARDKAIPVPSAWVLIAGDGAVWLGFAGISAVAQIALQRASALDAELALSSPWFAAGVLAVAGGWQFTPVKHACLTKCQRPMPFFMSHWRDDVAGVFTIGLKQGAYCLGCCWALMAVMFVTGTMNILWMLILGAVMMAEKGWENSLWLTRGLGVIMIAAAIAIAAMEFI